MIEFRLHDKKKEIIQLPSDFSVIRLNLQINMNLNKNNDFVFCIYFYYIFCEKKINKILLQLFLFKLCLFQVHFFHFLKSYDFLYSHRYVLL